jgi:Synaptobrevin
MTTTLSTTTGARGGQCILWSAILRDETLLVEARHDDCFEANAHRQQQREIRNPVVDETAHMLLAKKPTPGWEHVTLRRRRTGGNMTKLRGSKFHVYEHYGDDGRGIINGTDRHHQNFNSSNNNNKNNNCLTVWTFACVYDPLLVDEYQAKAFLEKIVTMTEIFRQPNTIRQEEDDGAVVFGGNDENANTNIVNYNFSKRNDSNSSKDTFYTPTQKCIQEEEDLWRYGSTYAVQRTFSPVLTQRMEEVSYLGKLAKCHEQLDSAKAVMARNIELILEQDERLENVIGRKAEECNEMASVFRKRSKQVKKQMLWNNAKHGLILGTAITAGVATIAVPTLIAIL